MQLVYDAIFKCSGPIVIDGYALLKFLHPEYVAIYLAGVDEKLPSCVKFALKLNIGELAESCN